MKIISHRGNLNGRSEEENSPTAIIKALSLGYDVEVDVHVIDNSIYLGHDFPIWLVSNDFLTFNKNHLWIHCKNYEAIEYFNNYYEKLNYFWHQEDDYTLTSWGYAWVYPNKTIFKNSICVLPENGYNGDISKCYAICTDYTERYSNE